MQTGKAEFGQRPIIRWEKQRIIVNRVAFDDSTHTSQAEGNVVVVDSGKEHYPCGSIPQYKTSQSWSQTNPL